jgi:predicted XRE-type DNA-binding protein
MRKKPEVTESDGNIFADLSIDNADEFYTRACLGVQVMKLLKGRSQKEAAKLLGVKQPEISALMRAKFSRFSQERLIGFLNKLDRKVTIQIRPTPRQRALPASHLGTLMQRSARGRNPTTLSEKRYQCDCVHPGGSGAFPSLTYGGLTFAFCFMMVAVR